MELYKLFNMHEYMTPPVREFDGDRCLRILTGNPMDECYALVDPTASIEDIEDELRWSLVRRWGHRFDYWALEGNYEDVTDLYYVSAEGWAGEGWYRIGWSDGGEDFTNDGPVWFEEASELADALKSASHYETETHLAFGEYLGCGEGPKPGQSARYEAYMLEAYLGDFAGDYDFDAIEADVRDRWAYLSKDELEATIEAHIISHQNPEE